MKKLALLLLTAGTALYASAHCESFFSHSFPNDASLGNPNGSVLWTILGAGEGETIESNYVIMPDGTFVHNGNKSICFHRDFTGKDRVDWFSPEFVQLRFISGSDVNPTPHITLSVEVIGENGTITYSFDQPVSDVATVTSAESKNLEGNFETMGNVKALNIYFDGVEDDEMLSMERINVYSHWYMPKVGPKVKARSLMYDPNVKHSYFWTDDTNAPIKLEEQGVTYIQAEDYDRSDINGHVAHTDVIAGGSNVARNFEPSDNNLYIAHHDDGPEYYGWDVNGRRYAGWDLNGKTNVSMSSLGFAVKNCNKSTQWYKYNGEYTDPVNKTITLQQAFDNFGVWLEYTVDVQEECDADVYLGMSVHGTPYNVALTYGGENETNCFWNKKVDGGYDVQGLSENYLKKYSFGVKLYLDGVAQKSAWKSAPRTLPDGLFADNSKVTTEDLCNLMKNPSKWTPYDDEDITFIFPIPYDIKDHNGTTIPSYYNWSVFYKEDMFKHLVETGEMTEDAAKPYMHGDFCNIHLTPGKHTFKVQTLGCLIFFDEFKIKAHGNDSSVKDIEADDNAIDYSKPVEYYDLQGRRVVNPETGLYIVRQGTKTAKRLIR